VRDVFYDWFDDERAPRPVSKTPPARLAARRKLLDSLLVEIASADDPLAGPDSTLGVSVLAKYPPDDKQRFDQYSQVGQVLDEFLDPRLELRGPHMPTLRPKLRKVPRRSLSMAIAFDCSSLRWVSSIRSF
jgi:hypothetical protein